VTKRKDTNVERTNESTKTIFGQLGRGMKGTFAGVLDLEKQEGFAQGNK